MDPIQRNNTQSSNPPEGKAESTNLPEGGNAQSSNPPEGSAESSNPPEGGNAQSTNLPEGNAESSNPPECNAESINPPEDVARYGSVYLAARKDDWKTVKKFIDEHPDTRTAEIDEFGVTILQLLVRKDYNFFPVFLMDPIQRNNTQSSNPLEGDAESSNPPEVKAESTNSSEGNADSTNSSEGKDFSPYIPLNRAALKGDWETVKTLLEKLPEARTAQIDEFGTTLLHLAVRKDESMWLVEDILNAIPPPSLEEVDDLGETALSYAVIAGNIKAATKLLEKNEGCLNIEEEDTDYTPLHNAARFGNEELVKFLFSKTDTDHMESLLIRESGANLFFNIICAQMYGIAIDILKRHMELDKNHLIKEKVLRTLAQKPQEFASGNHHYLNYWQRLIYQWIPQSEEKDYPLLSIVDGDIDNIVESSTNNITNSGFFQQISNGFGKVYLSFWNIMKRTVPWINHIHNMKQRHMQALELVRLICKETITFTYFQACKTLKEPLFIATSLGIVEIVNEIMEAFPNSVRFSNDDKQNIFEFAVLCRQDHVFKTINKMYHSKYFLTNYQDKDGNNILHLAGKLQPSSRISGAALQMQQELQWFKAIENFVSHVRPNLLEYQNNNKRTPREVFTEDHKDLVMEGQNWMKDTAKSYIIVTALIITVTFAAIFTVPGGTKPEGVPNYLHNSAFTTFVISDAAALVFSCISVLMYLGILTSRYSEEDFLESLPRKLILGIFTLYISLGCMMAAFSSALAIVFYQTKKQFFCSTVTLVWITMFLFASLQFPLLFEILRSTYGQRFLKPNKAIRFSFANFKK